MLAMHWASAKGMTTLSEDVETLLIRRRVAEAVYAVQNALGVVELGTLYTVPVQESNGCIVLSAVLGICEEVVKWARWMSEDSLFASQSPQVSDVST